MEVEDIRKLLDEYVANGVHLSLWSYLILAVVTLIAGFSGAYMKKRGENYATKQDFDDILERVKETTKTTEEVKAVINRSSKELELKLERRSEFEQQILLERYKLVCEFAQRLSQITTDLNRAYHGKKVEGLFDGNEVVPLTAVFEDLAAKKFQLSEQFHRYFYRQAQVVLSLANLEDKESRRDTESKYLQNLAQLTEMANAEFGTDKVSW